MKLTTQNLERAMCITLCAARQLPAALSRAEVLQLTNYHDWFARIPDIVENLHKRREEELIFDTGYSIRSRLYLYPLKTHLDRDQFPNSDFYMWPTHMNHGVDSAASKRRVNTIFETIEQRLFLEEFPVHLSLYKPKK